MKSTLATPTSSVAVAVIVTVPATLAAVGAVTATFVGGGELSTVTANDEVAAAPAFEDAVAVIVWLPAAKPAVSQSYANGADASVNLRTPSTRNATSRTPRGAEAAAVTFTRPRTVDAAAGEVRRTVVAATFVGSSHATVSRGRLVGSVTSSSE